MRSTTDHPGGAESASDAGHSSQWLPTFIQHCREIIEAHDATLERLRASVAAVEAERQQVRDAQSEAQLAQETIEGAMQRMQALKDSAASWMKVPPPRAASDAPGAPGNTGPEEPQSSAGEATEPIKITGERSLQLLRLLSSRPQHAWTTQEVAECLGEPTNDDGTRTIRTRLDYLCSKRILKKVQSPRKRNVAGQDNSYVRYRIAHAWKAA
ncbi:hypothetical protein ACIBI4_13985 [Streptomyces sp. NPDC050418]|uniref:hypothetical protein n=1 Tax=Streptomyces sp. NPDC050418 TaxID=3365612 RepID=UPI0037AB87AD